MKKIKTTLRNISPGFKNSKFGILNSKLNSEKGFTLVELIIVIAIIAVLAVAAFMMLTKWLGKSRDSRRLGDLGTIARGLQVGYSDTDDGVNMYPTVKDQDGAIALLSGADTVVGYQGVVDNDVVAGASMQKAPKDPSDGSYYTYLVSQNRQKFQLLSFLEDGSEVSMLNDVYALEYANMTPTTKGFELGVLLRQSDNMPVNLIGGGLTGVDLSTVNETDYKAIINDKTTKVGTGVLEIPLVDEDIIVVKEEVIDIIEEDETPTSPFTNELLTNSIYNDSSSTYQTYYSPCNCMGDKAFDNDESTAWTSYFGTNSRQEWISWKYNEPIRPSKIQTIAEYNTTYSVWRTRSPFIEASNDGINWTTIHESICIYGCVTPPVTNKYTITFDDFISEDSWLYFRLNDNVSSVGSLHVDSTVSYFEIKTYN